MIEEDDGNAAATNVRILIPYVVALEQAFDILARAATCRTLKDCEAD